MIPSDISKGAIPKQPNKNTPQASTSNQKASNDSTTSNQSSQNKDTKNEPSKTTDLGTEPKELTAVVKDEQLKSKHFFLYFVAVEMHVPYRNLAEGNIEEF